MSLNLDGTLLYVFKWAVLLDTELVSLRYALCLQNVPGFLQTSLGICETLFLREIPWLKSERCSDDCPVLI